MYANGLGVPQDYNKALYWYKKAAEQGYAPAKANLERLESEH
jgi:TPR repeat protein